MAPRGLYVWVCCMASGRGLMGAHTLRMVLIGWAWVARCGVPCVGVELLDVAMLVCRVDMLPRQEDR